MGELGIGVLGRGQPGTITYLYTDIVTEERVALKSISKEVFMTSVIQYMKKVNQEYAIMKHLLKHLNIVLFKEAYEDDKSLNFVMELCDGSELIDHIIALEHYTERQVAALIRNIMEVVQMLHKHKIMHWDLKPQNILFANKNVNSLLKVIDFGLAEFFKPREKLSGIVETLKYMASKMLDKEYGLEVDMWSAEVILYMMLSGRFPLWAKMEEATMEVILGSGLDLKSNPLPMVLDSAKLLVRHMLEWDPNT